MAFLETKLIRLRYQSLLIVLLAESRHLERFQKEILIIKSKPLHTRTQRKNETPFGGIRAG